MSGQLNSRPKEGIVTTKFMYKDLHIAEASLDLSEKKNGFGYLPDQGTFASFF